MSVAVEQRRDLESLYLETRDRVIDLLTNAEADTVVPACPTWTVKGVASHLAGICADVLAGNLAGAATDAWTDAQVAVRQAMTIGEIVAEWDTLAPQFAKLIDDFPGWCGRQVVADLTVHEQDLRGACGRPGARTSEALWRCLDFLMSAIVHPAASALGIGPVEFVADERSWRVGGDAGTGRGDPEEAVAAVLVSGTSFEPSGESPRASVSGPPFELCRALTGRRSAAQIRALDWTADPAPYIALFSQGPFALRSEDLNEPG